MLVMMVTVVNASADLHKVRYVKYGEMGSSEVVCNDFTFSIHHTKSTWRFRNFFNSLRSGDIIDVEMIEGTVINVKKVGHETPEYSNGGRVYTGHRGYYGGGYGSAHVGYTSRDGRTNIGVGSYRNYDGSTTVVVGGDVAGLHLELPVTLKKKSSKKTSSRATTTRVAEPATTAATTTTSTAATATKTVEVKAQTSEDPVVVYDYNKVLTEAF